MKPVCILLFALLATVRLPAATNETLAKLAIVPESADAATDADVLTAELTKNGRVQLLERAEIEKMYREQGLSAANQDYLKLGQMLGADGLLLLNVVRTPQVTNLTARLTAVKPGVVLTEGTVVWPLKDVSQWSQSIAVGLGAFLPKLVLLPRDAIPISLVNLRSAIQSDEAKETERQLKLLTIQRLSREPQLFVLERQRMQLLAEEKELRSDESAFWNGSYLLEGVVDQKGFSKDTLTINARLTPSKGGEPLPFEVRGARTNLAEVVNLLAAKMDELLKVNSFPAASWSAAEEAARYFDEANWALRWGVFTEARMAADSAWILGKHDMDCAVVRIKAYEAPLQVRGYQPGQFTNPQNTNEVIQSAAEYAAPNNPWGLRMRSQDYSGTKSVDYVYAYQFPDPAEIDFAMRALELYQQFSLNSPEGLLKGASGQGNRKNSDWYNWGIEDLMAASMVLQHFNFVPEAQKPVGDKLAELRRLARAVADWISRSPAVRDGYFVGDRHVTYGELVNTLEDNPDIFRCEVSWGCFWQEKPEDAIALYRELAGSPAFCYIHSAFWLRELQTPRLVAWNEADQQRIPSLWGNFMAEWNTSTNLLWRLEAKALALADADNDKDVGISFTNLFQAIFENHDALVNNPTEVVYLDWHLAELVSARTGGGIQSDLRESLNRLYYSQYSQKLDKMDREYSEKPVVDAGGGSEFEEQKKYLQDNRPFDFFEFVKLFQSDDFSKNQATEIKPLVVAYKANLVAQSANASGRQKGELRSAIAQVGFLEDNINRILNPPVSRPAPLPQVAVAPPNNPSKSASIAPVAEKAPLPELITNAITVNRAFTIPMEKLLAPGGSQRLNDGSQVTVTAHHWCENKLLLDVQYNLVFDEGNIEFAGQQSGQAIAVFDPAKKSWEVIAMPGAEIPAQNRFYNRTTLMNGSLYNCDGGEIRKYAFGTRQWETLKVSDGNNYELFAVNGQLYAANGNTIFEIIDGGNGTRMLASSRRRPPVSVLDTQDLGTPVLFTGPNHSLRANTGSKIFTLTGSDWSETIEAPPASFLPAVFEEGTLFRCNDGGSTRPMGLSFLPVETNAVDFCFWQKPPSPQNIFSPPSKDLPHKPIWTMPPNLSPAALPAVVHQTDLYLLVDHSQAQSVRGQKAGEGDIGYKYLPTDGYEAALLCYSRDLPAPQKIYLNFDAPDSCQPLIGSSLGSGQWMPAMPPIWMLFCSDFLVFGLEIPRLSAPYPGMAQRTDVGGKASIWLMPASQIEEARAPQKEIQLQQKTQAAAARGRAQKDFLSKYDLNHNGVVDPGEREAALDDTNFIESELDKIDVNHDGWIEAQELSYFDANQNRILDPKEQAGMDIAQHLFAGRLLNKFDANGDGVLDRNEFNTLWQTCMAAGDHPMSGGMLVMSADGNHDGVIDLGELETFLQRQTNRGLRASGAPNMSPMMASPNPSAGRQSVFKARVEAYWQNSGGDAHPAQSPP